MGWHRVRSRPESSRGCGYLDSLEFVRLFREFRLLTGFGSSGLGSLDEDLAY